MEPIRGGRLAKPPEKVRKYGQAHRYKDTSGMGAALGLEPSEVATALSGMGNMEQVVENLLMPSIPSPVI